MLYDPKTQWCIISDTMFRLCIPDEVKRASARHKETCGCVTCISMYGQLTSLNAFRKLRLRQMRTEIEHETDSDKKKSKKDFYDQYYQDVMLPDGTARHATTRDAMCSILCKPVGDTTMHRLKCVCSHCAACPVFKIPKAERRDDTDGPYIPFHAFKPVTRCSRHVHEGVLPTRATKCSWCEHPGFKEKNKGRVSTKTELVKYNLPIAKFMREYYIPTLQEYAYHFTLVKLLGKGPGSCGEMRMQHFLDSRGDGSCITEIHDFAERVDVVMAGAIQADHFGRKRNLSIEGCSLKYYDPIKRQKCHNDPVELASLRHEHEYHGHFSDKSKQDAATVFAHEGKMLTLLKELGVLRIVTGQGDGIERTVVTRLKNTDGCAKQYRSGTALFLMSQQVQKFPSIRIDAMIGAPGHGRMKSMVSMLLRRDTSRTRALLSSNLE
jgi:hypothetical protein